MTIEGLALGASRTACYLAVALVLGGLCFVRFAWFPALRSIRGASGEAEARGAFVRRSRTFAVAGAGLGAAGVAGTLAVGTRSTASVIWLAVELAGWLLVGGLSLSAAWPEGRDRSPTAAAFVGGGALATLALVLAGEPSSILVGALSTGHVIGAGVWVGGVVYLAAVLPAALGRLEPPRRTDLLLASLARFSPLALLAVIAIVLTGTVHTAVVLPTVAALWRTAFGRLIILKLLLVAILLGLGGVNRYRVIPTLRSRGSGRDARRATIVARRALALEVVGMVVVLAATSALVAAAPDTAARRSCRDLGPRRPSAIAAAYPSAPCRYATTGASRR